MSTAASLDKRRINGPDRVYQPVFRHAASAVGKVGESSKTSSAKGKQRSDGRGEHDLRPIYIQTNLIPQANGSCYIESGGLKLACAVYGPRQVRAQGGARQQFTDEAELHVECRYAPFANGGRTKPGKNLESTLLSSRIHSSLLPSIRLALLPKASLDVYITVLEADGPIEGVAALGVTAGSAALASAGVELWALAVGSVAAVSTTATTKTAAEVPSSPSVLVDPTRAEALASPASASSRPTFVSVTSMPALGSVLSLDVSSGGGGGGGDEGQSAGGSGGLELETLDKTVAILTQSAAQVHRVVAEALQESALSVTRK